MRKLLFIGNTYLSHTVRDYLFRLPYGLGLIKTLFTEAGVDIKILDFASNLQNILKSQDVNLDVLDSNTQEFPGDNLDIGSSLLKLLDDIFSDFNQIPFSDVVLSYQSNIDFNNSIIEPLIIAKYISLRFPTAKIIFGGPAIPDLDPKSLDKVNSYDFFELQNDISLKSLILKLGLSLEFDETSVEDIFKSDSDDINKTIYRLVPNFDDLNISNYEYSSRKIIKSGLAPRIPSLASSLKETIPDYRVSVMPLIFMKGCANNCSYCDNGLKKLSYLPVSKVVNIIRTLYAKYGIINYFFLNSEINFSNVYLNELLDELIKLDFKISWSDCAILRKLDKALLAKMAQSGCKRLSFGLESASVKLLKKFNKHCDLNEVKQILSDSHRLGIWNHICLIVGFPYETIRDIDITKRYLWDVLDFIDQITLNEFTYIPNTDIFQNPTNYGIRHSVAFDPDMRTQSGFDELNGFLFGDKKRISKEHTELILDFVRKLFETKKSLDLTYCVHMHYVIALSNLFKDKILLASLLEDINLNH